MMRIIRWGILGTGRIAAKFAADLAHVRDAELVAVGSRSLEKANDFASGFHIPKRHSSYEELAADPLVDVVYIATPHSLHYQNTLLCLEHNKAVLCEKPFALNAQQAAKMISLAQQKKLFLMDALWTKFHPHFILTQNLVKERKIGEVQSVLIHFGFKPPSPAPARLFDPALGGGTLLDIGIYNVFTALSFLGKPDSIDASASLGASGVDEQCSVLFRYRNGAMAQLFSSFASNLATEANICGSTGRIRLTNRFFEPSATIEYYSGHPNTCELIPFEKENGFGYQYEARHVNECLRNGLTESPVVTHRDTLELIGILDEIREKAGIRYPQDSQAAANS